MHAPRRVCLHLRALSLGVPHQCVLCSSACIGLLCIYDTIHSMAPRWWVRT